MRWKDIEYFDESWKKRIALMAQFIPGTATVLDLGCGKEWLKELIGEARYTGVDYKPRSPGTMVCDFNRRQFPDAQRDVAFVSGCLEYIDDPSWFIGRICSSSKRCVLSYCLLDTHQDVAGRRSAGWVNDLTLREICDEFEKHRFNLVTRTATTTDNAVLVFERSGGPLGADPARSDPIVSPTRHEHYALVSASNFLDVTWYLDRYPDVRLAGVDPVEHFLFQGAAELRNPGPLFDTRWYLEKNPDVAAQGINPLVHFLLHGRRENRHISAQDFLGRKVVGQADAATSLLDRSGSAPSRPEPANDHNWTEVRSQWKAYFLAHGSSAYGRGDMNGALDQFKYCVQVSPDSDEGYVLYRKAFTDLNAKALRDFEAAFSGADLVVAHVSCRARVTLAKASAQSFHDERGRIRNLIVVGDPALAPDTFEFRPDQNLLVVPSSDMYEGLPRKVQKLFLFLGHASVEVPVLKIDDDLQCRDIENLRRDLEQVISRTAYGGGVIVPAGPFVAATYWHLNKCADRSVNERPDSLIFGAPFVAGKYYWLDGPTVNALSKMTLAHDRLFETEIYEDRAVGTVLHHYGFSVHRLDLIESGTLAHATDAPCHAA